MALSNLCEDNICAGKTEEGTGKRETSSPFWKYPRVIVNETSSLK